MTKNVVIRILPEQRKLLQKLGGKCHPKLTASAVAIKWINWVIFHDDPNKVLRKTYGKTTTN